MEESAVFFHRCRIFGTGIEPTGFAEVIFFRKRIQKPLRRNQKLFGRSPESKNERKGRYDYPDGIVQIWVHTKIFRGSKISEEEFEISERTRYRPMDSIV